ncbi:heterokaryon incompatibility protein-domain-containing protein [Xylaria telfairii]|nr:heterokaryon incompatibility protein-domain-containing protein [Xylaria telfairii]
MDGPDAVDAFIERFSLFENTPMRGGRRRKHAAPFFKQRSGERALYNQRARDQISEVDSTRTNSMPRREANLWGPPDELDAITRFFKKESLCDFCLRTPVISLIRRLGSDVAISTKVITADTPCRLCQVLGSTEAEPKILVPDPGSWMQIQLLSDWIQECHREHQHEMPLCSSESPRLENRDGSSSTRQPGAPLRLIDVGSGRVPLRVKLVDNKVQKPPPYIALSHRWTSATGLCSTTSHNLEARYGDNDGILIADLPPTFQHAIHATRRLGIGYIWIDSLCINQEDEREKGQECARMELIYRQAYCVFAATSDESPMCGLFDRPFLGQPFYIPNNPGNTSLLIRKFDRQASFERDIQSAQLNTRGWVFQERALAVHTIHFCAREVYWECGTMTRRESPTLVGGPPEALNPLGSSYFPEITPTRSVSAIEAFQRYSRLGLTYHADRSLAILGLEYRLAIHLKTPFIYGIQANNAIRTLFWKRSSDTPLLEIRPRVPSWSWMSRMGSIVYVQLKPDVPKELQLKYATVPFRDHGDVVYQNNDTRYFCQLGSILDEVETKGISVYSLDTWTGLVLAQKLIGWVCFDDATKKLPKKLHRVIICSGQSEEGELLTLGAAGRKCDFALLVAPDQDVRAREVDGTNQEPGYYRRVGVGIFVQDALKPQDRGRIAIL